MPGRPTSQPHDNKCRDISFGHTSQHPLNNTDTVPQRDGLPHGWAVLVILAGSWDIGPRAAPCCQIGGWPKTFWAFYPAVGDQSVVATSAMASNNGDMFLHGGDQLWQPHLFLPPYVGPKLASGVGTQKLFCVPCLQEVHTLTPTVSLLGLLAKIKV